MREQIDRIEQDKEWLVCMEVCREQSAGRFRREGKMLEMSLERSERIAWH